MRELTVGYGEFAALAAEILGAGNVLRFRANGSSMSPSIRDGEIVLVTRLEDASPVRYGDIILCRYGGGRLLGHRVVRVSKENGRRVLTTQGDALSRPDEQIAEEQVLGRVVAVQRVGRHAQLDGGWLRLMGLLWIALSPFSRWSYHLAGAVVGATRRWRATLGGAGS